MTAVPEISRYVSIYRALPAREQKVLLASLALLPFFWLGLRLAGLRRFQAWLDHSPIARRAPLSQLEAAALGDAVNRAANRVLGPANCLTRSLLLRWLLRRFGTASDMRIGVCFEEGALAAHAWVEIDGMPLNDTPEAVARFAAFDQPVSPEIFS
jgi:Transglutaminase-like superfamily